MAARQAIGILPPDILDHSRREVRRSAVWTLLAISFAYGIFHAAGPGHGKAVISSYLVANQETARRGIVLSFASALMQSLVAVAIVGFALPCSTPPPKPCAEPKE